MKQIVLSLAYLVIFPLFFLYWALCRFFNRTGVFQAFSQLLSLAPGISGQFLRRAFYTLSLQHCGSDACISFGVLITHPATRIGRLSYIGPYSMLGEIRVGDDCLIGSHVSIINGNHQHGIDRLDIPVREQAGVYKTINIGKDSWVGDRAVVMASLGEHCVVGAGAVVTADLPNYAIAVGCPARIIGYRNQQSRSALMKDS